MRTRIHVALVIVRMYACCFFFVCPCLRNFVSAYLCVHVSIKKSTKKKEKKRLQEEKRRKRGNIYIYKYIYICTVADVRLQTMRMFMQRRREID